MKQQALAYIIALVLLIPAMGNAAETIRVNTSIKPPFSTEDETGFFDVLLKELAKRMDVDFQLVRQPPERALVSINNGASDMELPRIAGLEKRYKNLVMVPEKVIDYNFVAFSRTKMCLRSWDALSKLRVGYLIGWKIFEKNVPDGTSITKLNRPDLMFDMLDMGRIDIGLYERHAGWHMIRDHGHDSIKECDPPLAVRPMYIYLHKSQEGLAPLIASQLKAMKSDGTYKKIMDATLRK
ncbi:transporter substrate-binding domain-containing protein [Pseudodesulfovibrio sp. zrk46]|uniref:substrate-binding periplasmic protein n=1 Tax=Pseudodesulfovibrio sp. zrk46 TaxID=2725288 RepID=UPI00144929A7|nr:transporter substrate-binding domain-containing protein [Pseudodesulfovibrio sp. zrk46]QJB56133.1 amino acid ABC transporter substrate-binding protein [Pseudodesulfovibrio sp. zrk46]